MYGILTSSLLLVNKSLIISRFSFSIAKCKAVLLIHDIIAFKIKGLKLHELKKYEFYLIIMI